MVIGSSLHFPCNTQHTVIFISLSLLWNGVWRPTFFWVNHESITTLSGCLKLIDTLRVNHWGEIGRSQLVYKFQPGQYVNGLWTMDWEAAGLAKKNCAHKQAARVSISLGTGSQKLDMIPVAKSIVLRGVKVWCRQSFSEFICDKTAWWGVETRMHRPNTETPGLCLVKDFSRNVRKPWMVRNY